MQLEADMKRKKERVEIERNRGEVGRAFLIHLIASHTSESKVATDRENYLKRSFFPYLLPDPYATGG